ncbi:MAG TPA: hypothetical protein VL727_00775 [Puia sp.]|nr:hypothetical protein [Puia sp.]
MKRLIAVLAAGALTSTGINAQQLQPYRTPAQKLILTSEDSLNNNTAKNKTVISGYGSAFYQRDFKEHQATITLDRLVLFVGHSFNEKISLFTELEVENAIVAGAGSDEPTSGRGSVAMEQAFLKFNLNARQYLVAGLFTPRIGITNENHLPVNFNGVERPIVEQLIIPTTWREIGVGLYGTLDRLPLNYSIAIMNGLNSANFHHDSGLGEGLGLGSNASANNLAITASVQYRISDIKFQLAGYMGGTVGLSKRSADSLNVGLQTGAFGTPLYLGEFDVQYAKNGFSAKALGTYIAYPDADKIYRAYAKSIGSGMYGAYLELAYDWLHHLGTPKQFITFARAEMLDLNSQLPSLQKNEDQYDGTLKQRHIIAGISYFPIPNVVVKADVRLMHTGSQNPALVINPPPNALPYQQNQQFLNIGLGYSF